jgi:PTH1 family peptidyl-tRNA hydrolase
MFLIFGLGNPGEEYEGTRHNVGRMIVSILAKNNDFDDFSLDKKSNSLISSGKIGKEKVELVMPEGFMNNSGKTVGSLVKTKTPFEKVIVIHDDLDIPIGSIKVSFGKKPGGHRGVESISKVLKSDDFIRVRIGISPKTSSGRIKKPKGEKEVIDFILGRMNKNESEAIKKTVKNGAKVVEDILNNGLSSAMNFWNSST